MENDGSYYSDNSKSMQNDVLLNTVENSGIETIKKQLMSCESIASENSVSSQSEVINNSTKSKYRNIDVSYNSQKKRPIFKCPHCPKVFSNSSAIAKHKLTHSDERRYSCEQCGKAFKRQDHLNGHKNTHKSKKPHGCKLCDRSYSDARSLRRHYENQHQEEFLRRKLAVSIGDTSGANSSCSDSADPLDILNGEKITRSVHCEICHRAFRNQAALNGHMRLHGGYGTVKNSIRGPGEPKYVPNTITAISTTTSTTIATAGATIVTNTTLTTDESSFPVVGRSSTAIQNDLQTVSIEDLSSCLPQISSNEIKPKLHQFRQSNNSPNNLPINYQSVKSSSNQIQSQYSWFPLDIDSTASVTSSTASNSNTAKTSIISTVPVTNNISNQSDMTANHNNNSSNLQDLIMNLECYSESTTSNNNNSNNHNITSSAYDFPNAPPSLETLLVNPLGGNNNINNNNNSNNTSVLNKRKFKPAPIFIPPQTSAHMSRLRSPRVWNTQSTNHQFSNFSIIPENIINNYHNTTSINNSQPNNNPPKIPPYTPPPMLSPQRKGSGLFNSLFHLCNLPQYRQQQQLLALSALQMLNNNNSNNGNNLYRQQNLNNMYSHNNNSNFYDNQNTNIIINNNSNSYYAGQTVSFDEINNNPIQQQPQHYNQQQENVIISPGCQSVKSTIDVVGGCGQDELNPKTPMKSELQSSQQHSASLSSNHFIYQDEYVDVCGISVAGSDEGLPTSAEPRINIGKEYQAEIPDFHGDRTCVDNDQRIYELLLWHPKHFDETPDNLATLESLMKIASSPAVKSCGLNTEYTFHLIFKTEGDLEKTMRILLEHSFKVYDYVYAETTTWKTEEISQFQLRLKQHDRDFKQVSMDLCKNGMNKSVKACVEFYYVWKQMNSHKDTATYRSNNKPKRKLSINNDSGTLQSNPGVVLVGDSLIDDDNNNSTVNKPGGYNLRHKSQYYHQNQSNMELPSLQRYHEDQNHNQHRSTHLSYHDESVNAVARDNLTGYCCDDFGDGDCPVDDGEVDNANDIYVYHNNVTDTTQLGNNNSKPYKCSYCKKSFSKWKTRENHQMKHLHNNSDAIYTD